MPLAAFCSNQIVTLSQISLETTLTVYTSVNQTAKRGQFQNPRSQTELSTDTLKTLPSPLLPTFWLNLKKFQFQCHSRLPFDKDESVTFSSNAGTRLQTSLQTSRVVCTYVLQFSFDNVCKQAAVAAIFLSLSTDVWVRCSYICSLCDHKSTVLCTDAQGSEGSHLCKDYVMSPLCYDFGAFWGLCNDVLLNVASTPTSWAVCDDWSVPWKQCTTSPCNWCAFQVIWGAWSDLWAFGKSERNQIEQNQITCRQGLPKVYVYLFHSQNKDQLRIFSALLVILAWG